MWIRQAHALSTFCRAAEEAERVAAAAKKKAEIAEQLKKEEEEIAAGRKLRGEDKVAARKSAKIMREGAAIDEADGPILEARGIDAALAALTIATGGEGGGEGDDLSRAQNLLRENTTGIKVRTVRTSTHERLAHHPTCTPTGSTNRAQCRPIH